MKVTIYSKSEFMGNIVATETKLKSFTFRKYAQYPNALEVIHTPKRKRTSYRKIYTPCGGSPDILILEGWNNPEPNGIYDESKTIVKEDVTIQKGSYSCFDDRWQSDFDSMINDFIKEKDLKVVLDTRGSEAYFEEIRKEKEKV
jgi:hypothetical protein